MVVGVLVVDHVRAAAHDRLLCDCGSCDVGTDGPLPLYHASIRPTRVQPNENMRGPLGDHAMRQMHLNLFIQGRGHHEAAWRHPKSSPLALTDISYTVELAQKAEAHFFDAIFLADVLGLWNDVEGTPFNWLEPLTTLAALAMATSRGGLIATCSTSYTEAYNLARQFARRAQN